MSLICLIKGHEWTDWVVKSSPITIGQWDSCKGKYVYLPGVKYVRTRKCQRNKCDAAQRIEDKHTVSPGRQQE